MENFNHIFNWKLLEGSHDFPGPDGGTCINEAAIIAAGFEYKKIHSARDCPPCFSRVIAAYALRLNDKMPDELRNRLLMPFVTRLAGTADTREVELTRVHFIAIETVKRILSLVCEKRLNRHDLAEKCRAVKNVQEAVDVSRKVRKISSAYASSAYAAAASAYAAAAAASAAYAYASSDAASASAYAAAAAAAGEKIYTICTQILDETILMGKHQELEACEVTMRLEKSKRERVAA